MALENMTASNSIFLGFEPWEEKVVIGTFVSVVAFGVLAGLIASLVVTGNLMKFFEMKAHLTIGQGLLYIALPILGSSIITALGVKYREHLRAHIIQTTS